MPFRKVVSDRGASADSHPLNPIVAREWSVFSAPVEGEITAVWQPTGVLAWAVVIVPLFCTVAAYFVSKWMMAIFGVFTAIALLWVFA
jgi:hypothetical protein